MPSFTRVPLLLKLWAACLPVAAGVYLFSSAGIITGGTIGLTLSVSYMTQLPFSWIYFFINVPFYAASWLYLGKAFTYRTITAVVSLSLISRMFEMLPAMSIPAWLGAIAGGLCLGGGMLALFQLHSSLGGVNIVVLLLQRKYRRNVGATNFILDFFIILSALVYADFSICALSILSVLVCSMIIGRYKGSSSAKTIVETRRRIEGNYVESKY